MKKIAIDMSSAQPYGNVVVNGGGQYAENILRELVSINISKNIVVLLNRNKGINNELEKIIQNNNLSKFYFSTYTDLSSAINESSVWLTILPVCYPEYSSLSISSNKRLITVIHDLSSVYADGYNGIKERYIDSYKNIIKLYLKRIILHKNYLSKHIQQHQAIMNLTDNQLIITDSEFSKSELVKIQNKLNNITVYYPYLFDTENIFVDDNFIEKYQIEKKKYCLFVSGARWHKNNYFACKAIDSELSKKNNILSKYKYVITGMDDLHIEYYNEHLKNINSFVFVKYIDREEYNSLMKNAIAFIYPSLFEGFGAPPIEAMRLGTLPICSMSTSIPEICGDAAVYFDPQDSDSFLRALSILERDEDIQMLVSKGRCRFKYIYEKQKVDTNKLVNMINEMYCNE